MTTPTTPGLVYDMPEHVYHARPELSSTGVRNLLDSPARYQWELAHRTESKAFDVGRAVHTKILGAGGDIIVYPDEFITASGWVSTRPAAKAWEATQRADGLTPLTPADAAKVDAMAEAVLAHREARRLLELPGASEVSAFAKDPETGVKVRARFDRLADGLTLDVKTTSGIASAAGFGSTAAKYGYPVQDAHYIDTYEWITGERVPMYFLVVEKNGPHLVAVHRFDEATRLVARDLALKARRIYAECLATDEWPAYSEGVIETQLPSWWYWQNEDDDQEMEIAI